MRSVSDCPPARHRPGSEPTMLQATWQEETHRERTPLQFLRATVTRFMRMRPKTPPSYTSSTVSAQDTHEPNRHRLFVFILIRNIIWSANLWRTRNLRMSANVSGENSVKMITADVNVTRANVFTTAVGLPTPTLSSMGAESTMLQETWREQAHRARRTSLETCRVATHGSQ